MNPDGFTRRDRRLCFGGAIWRELAHTVPEPSTRKRKCRGRKFDQERSRTGHQQNVRCRIPTMGMRYRMVRLPGLPASIRCCSTILDSPGHWLGIVLDFQSMFETIQGDDGCLHTKDARDRHAKHGDCPYQSLGTSAEHADPSVGLFSLGKRTVQCACGLPSSPDCHSMRLPEAAEKTLLDHGA